MAERAEPVQIRRWPGGWFLVGNGPSYLLFCPKGEVLHLASSLYRQLRQDLKGYQAIGDDDKPVPLVRALELARADAVYDLDRSANTTIRKWADYNVVREIQELIALSSREPKIFEGRARRFVTSMKAAGILAMYRDGPPAAPGGESSPPGTYFSRDRHGRRLLIVSNPYFVLRCEPASRIAGCAQELWRKERDQWCWHQEQNQDRWMGQRTVLYLVPTRRQLQEYLCSDGPTVTKVCRAAGFDWLPRASAGRHRRRPSPA
jgi:hypothetical protein